MCICRDGRAGEHGVYCKCSEPCDILDGVYELWVDQICKHSYKLHGNIIHSSTLRRSHCWYIFDKIYHLCPVWFPGIVGTFLFILNLLHGNWNHPFFLFSQTKLITSHESNLHTISTVCARAFWPSKRELYFATCWFLKKSVNNIEYRIIGALRRWVNNPNTIYTFGIYSFYIFN